jgi:hypothetical protein
MELNRFKQLLESTMGNVKPLLTENSVASELYSKQVDIAQTIGSWFPSKFTQFKGVIDDDEDAAIEYLKSTLWPPIAKKLKEIDDRLWEVRDKTMHDRLWTNNKHLTGIGINEDANGYTFLTTMRGAGTFGDTWEIRVKDPVTGSISSVKVDTDF